MTPIKATIARTDLWDKNGFIYCGASLSLPATQAEIEDAMDRARITAGQPFKIVECIDNDGCEMDYLPENPKLEELNFLAHRLKDFTEDYEVIQFKALCEMEKEPPTMLRLINLTANMQDCICFPVSNHAELGEHYVENEFLDEFNNLSNEMCEYLDYAKIGKKAQEDEGGIFFEATNGIYYVVNNATEEEFKEVYKQSDISKPLASEPSVPNLPEHAYNNATLEELNELAFTVSDLKVCGQYAKYKAILEAEKVNSVSDAIELAKYIDDYELIPEISYAADYGKYEFFKTYNIKHDDPAVEHLQFGNYGHALAEEHNAQKTEYGFIRKISDMEQEQAQGGMTQSL